MSVHKLAKYCAEDPFTRVPNDLINDVRLDLKSRGLLVFMLSKPDGWTFRERSLANQTGVGRDQLRGAMQRLIELGYVIRRWEPRGEGPPIMVTAVYDRAQIPEVGIPEVGKPDRRETQPLSNERVLVTKENNLATASRERPRDVLFETVADVCGYNLKALTKTARGRLNAAVKELRDIQADPDQIVRFARRWKQTYPDATLTPQAITGNWAALAPSAAPATCQCGQLLDYHDTEVHDMLTGDQDG